MQQQQVYSYPPDVTSSLLTASTKTPKLPPLPPGDSQTVCLGCICPCFPYSKLIKRMQGDSNGRDWTACLSWAAVWGCCWAGAIVGPQIALPMVSGATVYAIDTLYLLFYVGYILPHLQVLSIYRQIQLRRSQAQVDLTLTDWSTALCCPCTLMGRVDKYFTSNNQQPQPLYLEDTCNCPLGWVVGPPHLEDSRTHLLLEQQLQMQSNYLPSY